MAGTIHSRFPHLGRDLSMIRNPGKAIYCLVIMSVKSYTCSILLAWVVLASPRSRTSFAKTNAQLTVFGCTYLT